MAKLSAKKMAKILNPHSLKKVLWVCPDSNTPYDIKKWCKKCIKFVRADSMQPKFNGVLNVFIDFKLSKKMKCKFYGFNILVSVAGMSDNVRCGEIKWDARFAEKEQALNLGKQIAEDLNINLLMCSVMGLDKFLERKR